MRFFSERNIFIRSFYYKYCSHLESVGKEFKYAIMFVRK